MKDYSEVKYGRRSGENLFSNWFPKVRDCGIPVPMSIVFQTPLGVQLACYMEKPQEDRATVDRWVNEIVLPALVPACMHNGLLFVKNGVFSNKFDAHTCMVLASGLTDAIININNAAMCMIPGLDGTQELVIRERIRMNPKKFATIYNGLPLTSEYRIFYDFDTHEIISVHNYWDYDYVYPHLYDLTDKIVFEHERSRMDARYRETKDEVCRMVAEHMAVITDLHGPWSVDIMWDGIQYWLIDMAVAEESAYWEFREQGMGDTVPDAAAEECAAPNNGGFSLPDCAIAKMVVDIVGTDKRFAELELKAAVDLVKQFYDRFLGARCNDPIEDLGLSARTYNRLKAAGVNTVGDLLYLAANGRLGDISGMSQPLVEEVNTALEQRDT